MTRTILLLISIATLAPPASLTAEPTPSADRPSRTKTTSKVAPTASGEGWSYVKGEWVHPDGYKYVKGQVIRTGAQTQKGPPKPPSKALLDSVKAKPTPTIDPNSAAAKAAEKERNLRPRPAPQTGTHL